jgi:hypothetical protein
MGEDAKKIVEIIIRCAKMLINLLDDLKKGTK